MPRNDIRKGDFILGGTGPEPAQVHVKKDAIRRGMFLTSTPAVGKAAKRYKLPTQFQEFEQAANLADQLTVEDKIHDLARRFARLREGLDTVAKARKLK
ncbi:hypothetical protein [Bradyrhizobium sp. 604_D8_N2_3]|uniref:hypothetical protein n=1 Tax=Bradyrhizobium sp. 604_D8_N2_3 TaxID=3240370 RepID=UPI003F1F0499